MKVVVKIRRTATHPLPKKDAKTNEQSNSLVLTEIKISFWQKLWWIIKGKASKDGVYASILFAGVLESFFNMLAVIGGLGLAALIVTAIPQIGAMTWVKNQIWNNIATIFFMVVIWFLMFVFTLMFRGAANDIKCEKDRNYIVALFSGVVSFVALVVSVIALVQGVS